MNKSKIAELAFSIMALALAIFLLVHFGMQHPSEDSLINGRIAIIILSVIAICICFVHLVYNLSLCVDHIRHKNKETIAINSNRTSYDRSIDVNNV